MTFLKDAVIPITHVAGISVTVASNGTSLPAAHVGPARRSRRFNPSQPCSSDVPLQSGPKPLATAFVGTGWVQWHVDCGHPSPPQVQAPPQPARRWLRRRECRRHTQLLRVSVAGSTDSDVAMGASDVAAAGAADVAVAAAGATMSPLAPPTLPPAPQPVAPLAPPSPPLAPHRAPPIRRMRIMQLRFVRTSQSPH